MSMAQPPGSPSGKPLCNDATLCAARTDHIDLSPEDERTVTAAVEALQHMIKRTREKKESSAALDSPTDEALACGSATEYLGYFSYGLTPGEARYIVYRFLKTNGMNIPKALDDLSRSAEFRTKQNLDKMALFPCLISISGFDQPAMCEELHIPFVHNLTSGKRYVDAEGRLRLEQDELDYYNVRYDELYANLGASGATHESTPYGLTDSAPTFGKDSATRSKGASGKAQSGAKNQSPRRDDNDKKGCNDGELRKGESFGSMFSNEDDARRKLPQQSATGNGGSSGGWHFPSPFHFLSRGKDKNASATARSRSTSFATKSPDGNRRTTLFHSALSLNGQSGEDANDDERSAGGSDDDEVSDDQSAISRGPILLNPAAAGETLAGSPFTLYHDSLNFHGILQPIVATVTKHVPFAFHYWDREGHPIMYCRLGGLDSKQLIRDLFALTPVDAEPRALAVLFNTYALAVVAQLIRYCNRKNMESNEIHDALMPHVQRRDRHTTPSTQAAGLFRKKAPVGSCVVVVDCAGLHLHRYLYKPLLVMVKSIVSLNVRHYPELMHHAYIVNCRRAMSVSYLMIRSLLSEETRQKVTFCSRQHTTATLVEKISSDLLPHELGGKCQCPGGCIPSVTAAMPDADKAGFNRSHFDAHSSSTSLQSDTSSAFHMGDHFSDADLVLHPLHCTVERLNLGARGSKTLTFAIDAHAEIIWEFVAKDKQKVTFSAVFVSAGDDGAMLSLVPSRRVRNDAGHYISASMGTVIFKWSNKQSFFRSCRVNLKVYREERTVASMDSP